MSSPEIRNSLAELRQKRGLSAAALASTVGVSRQTIYAIEAGNYVPNTAVALRLAKTLDVGVEQLFALQDDSSAPELPSEQVRVLPGSESLQAGQPVQLCQVDKHLVASPSSPMPWYLPSGDAIVAEAPRERGKARVQVYDPEALQSRILIAGCDPGISILARHAQAAGVQLVLAHRNSSQALTLLKEGWIHVAGTHLRDDASGESNLPQIGRMFSRNSIAVISFAVWEEGIVTAVSNPKGILQIADFSRKDVRIVNREEGAGSRLLLDTHLKRLKIAAKNVRGYDSLAAGHLPAAWQVRTGIADCCITTRAAARLFGLGFVPLVSERYDLAIRRDHLNLPSVQTLFDTLSRSSFRRELESTGGYDTSGSGQRLL